MFDGMGIARNHAQYLVGPVHVCNYPVQHTLQKLGWRIPAPDILFINGWTDRAIVSAYLLRSRARSTFDHRLHSINANSGMRHAK